jgi:hypothetical protein
LARGWFASHRIDEETSAEEFRRLKQASDAAGLDTALIDHAEAKRHWPLMNFESATAILGAPSDGYMTQTAW